MADANGSLAAASAVGVKAQSKLRRNTLVVLGTAGTIVPAVLLLYFFPPDESSFYPRCTFHSLTGLNCPGCGTTRALHALLHGEFQQAAAYNLLFLLSLPAVLYYVIRFAAAFLSGREFRDGPLAMVVLRWWFVAAVVFGIVRNIGFWPFTLLAPHSL